MPPLFQIEADLARSNGSHLHDGRTGKKYLDLFGFYSSLPLGYNHPIFNSSFYGEVSQVAAVKVATNSMIHSFRERFIDALTPWMPHKGLHFTCTGALAIEAAIKAAMYARRHPNPRVLSLRNSFHGINAWGLATSRVGVTARRMAYYPPNDWPNLGLEAAIDLLEAGPPDDIVALLVEPLQATSGDIHLDPERLRTLVDAARRRAVCVIFDEIQTGFGTTGSMWYSEQLGIVPDILVFGKKAQVSGICTSDEFSAILQRPDQLLDVTFDGDMIDMIRATYILEAIKQDNLLENARQVGVSFRDVLADLTLNFRSAGCLVAFDLPDGETRDAFARACFQSRILVNRAGDKTIRLRPNLAFDKKLSKEFRDSVVAAGLLPPRAAL
jgi:L-lysine 6-transaminase